MFTFFRFSFHIFFFSDELDQKLMKEMLLTYIPGKGDHLVPIIFPIDTKKALDFLCDKDVRKSAGVKETNPFIFPSTKYSDLHLSGWHAVDRICEKLNLQNRSKLNATKNRHRVSTLYSSLHLPSEKRDSFMTTWAILKKWTKRGTYCLKLHLFLLLILVFLLRGD